MLPSASVASNSADAQINQAHISLSRASRPAGEGRGSMTGEKKRSSSGSEAL